MGGRSGSRGGGGGGLVLSDLTAAQIKGLNARELKAAWKDTFGGAELTSVKQVYDLLGVTKDMLGPKGEIHVSGGRYGSALRVHVSGNDFFSQRTFHKGQASHDQLFLKDKAQGKGIGTDILRRATQSYAQLGIKSVSLSAASMGRYVWPKMGFRVSASDMREYRAGFTKFLESQGVTPPKRIYSVNQIARTTLNGRQLGKEYLLSKDAPNVKFMTIRTRRLAQYLASK
jgi:GNAT superfamily N-acetyltransferase